LHVLLLKQTALQKISGFRGNVVKEKFLKGKTGVMGGIKVGLRIRCGLILFGYEKVLCVDSVFCSSFSFFFGVVWSWWSIGIR
jgi:hypothetical protein